MSEDQRKQWARAITANNRARRTRKRPKGLGAVDGPGRIRITQTTEAEVAAAEPTRREPE